MSAERTREEPSRAAGVAPRQMQLTVTDQDAGLRLDQFLAAHLPDFSRTRLRSLVDRGSVQLNGRAEKPSHRVAAGDTLLVKIPRPAPAGLEPEPMALDILYEDDHVVVVNKPAGMIVHPGAGAKRGTLANALLHHFGSRGKLSSVGGELRPGIVHRLDRETSGALLVACDDAAHHALAEGFRTRQIEKTYLALVHGRLQQEGGRIELPVARDLHRPMRMTTRRREGRAARTDWRVLLRLDGYTLVEADLHTGRTHQIRVHFSALGHPVVGDTLYGAPREPRIGPRPVPALGRFFLHAARLKFLHPVTSESIEVRAPLPPALRDFLRLLARAAGIDEHSVDAALAPYL